MATLGSQPMNAMRIEPDGATSGWYIWCGEELSQDDDFLEPLHTKHLPDHFPEMVKYLALGPGWRVLLAPGQEFVWFDEKLVDGLFNA